MSDMGLTVRTAAAGVSLGWERVPGAERYEIMRRADGTDWDLIGSVGDTSFIDGETFQGVHYTYRVAAHTDAGPVLSDIGEAIAGGPCEIGKQILDGKDWAR
jgi:hypothetical protein